MLCDDDRMLRSMVELVLDRCGHEVVGIAENTTDGSSLVLSTKPDLVILDGSLGVNTDFDVIEAANDVNATVIVFSFYADEAVMSRYPVHPIVVAKPDFDALQRNIELLPVRHPLDAGSRTADAHSMERRHRPSRTADGPAPSGVGDAGAFYEALSNGGQGDAIVSLDIAPLDGAFDDDSPAVLSVRRLVREGDRVLAAGSSLKIFLPAGGEPGAKALLARLGSLGGLPATATAHYVAIEAGESPIDAFDRLKKAASPRT